MLRLTSRDVRHECEWVKESAFPFHLLRTWIRLPSSGVTCSVALILVFHSSFSRDSGIFSFHLGALNHFPQLRYTSPKLSQSIQAGSLWRQDQKVRGSGCTMVWKKLQGDCGILSGLWNIFAPNWRTHPRPQPQAQGSVSPEL